MTTATLLLLALGTALHTLDRIRCVLGWGPCRWHRSFEPEAPVARARWRGL